MVDRTLAEHRTFSRAGGRQNPPGNTWPLFFNFRSNSSWPGTFFFFFSIWGSVNLLRFKSSLQSTAGLVSSPILDSCTWDFLAFFLAFLKLGITGFTLEFILWNAVTFFIIRLISKYLLFENITEYLLQNSI